MLLFAGYFQDIWCAWFSSLQWNLTLDGYLCLWASWSTSVLFKFDLHFVWIWCSPVEHGKLQSSQYPVSILSCFIFCGIKGVMLFKAMQAVTSNYHFVCRPAFLCILPTLLQGHQLKIWLTLHRYILYATFYFMVHAWSYKIHSKWVLNNNLLFNSLSLIDQSQVH